MWSSFNEWALLLIAAIMVGTRALHLPTSQALAVSLQNNTAFGVNRISFIDTVRAAHLSSVSRYSRARLVSVQASTTGEPTDDPKDPKDVRLIFAIPNRFPSRTLIVSMSPWWGVWMRPEWSPNAPPLNLVDLPLDFGMDIVEADALIKQHGYDQRFWWVSAGWPTDVTPVGNQVYYVFEMEDEQPGETDTVVVGTRDRSVVENVYPEPPGRGMQAANGRRVATS